MQKLHKNVKVYELQVCLFFFKFFIPPSCLTHLKWPQPAFREMFHDDFFLLNHKLSHIPPEIPRFSLHSDWNIWCEKSGFLLMGRSFDVIKQTLCSAHQPLSWTFPAASVSPSWQLYSRSSVFPSLDSPSASARGHPEVKTYWGIMSSGLRPQHKKHWKKKAFSPEMPATFSASENQYKVFFNRFWCHQKSYYSVPEFTFITKEIKNRKNWNSNNTTETQQSASVPSWQRWNEYSNTMTKMHPYSCDECAGTLFFQTRKKGHQIRILISVLITPVPIAAGRHLGDVMRDNYYKFMVELVRQIRKNKKRKSTQSNVYYNLPSLKWVGVKF